MSGILLHYSREAVLVIQSGNTKSGPRHPSKLTTRSRIVSNTTYTVRSGESCANIARNHGVPRASLIGINNIRPDCGDLRAGQELCLPEPCLLYDIYLGTTCIDIMEANNITMNALFAWNPYINRACTNLVAGDQVCIGQPGALPSPTTPSPAPIMKTSGYATATVTPPGPIPHGTTKKCGQFYQVRNGDFCDSISDRFSIALDLFRVINPAINVDCTNLVPGLYYCVLPTEDWNSTTTTTAVSTYITAPEPTPSGTTGHCYEWYVVRSGDTCIRIASLYAISIEDMRVWNPSLREDCSNLRPGHAYCIHGDRPDARSPKWAAAEPTADAVNTSDFSRCLVF
ncbi:hypothetical protein BDW59DRAFT_172120 [Aspergillus cavernicola]|uniref:LysM domain-containing protein n=1 Tax=Aspergillus cavernicola TaxID=176166 RepID=A0ABR4IDN6_9EURO